MKGIWLSLLLGVPLLAAGDSDSLNPMFKPAGVEVMNFALLDYNGHLHELRRTDARAVVLYFTMNGCPIARQSYAKLRSLQKKFSESGVTIWIINVSDSESRSDIEKEARDFGAGSLPMLIDEAQGVAQALGVQRAAEAVAIGTKDWKIFYRGALDDQLTEGAKKPAATEKYLQRALEAFVGGKPVIPMTTVVHGCRIHVDGGKETNTISYAKDIGPLLARKCADCHSTGNIGPWAMTSYRKVKSMADMTQEVLLARRMPPWDADPHYGKFSNDRALTREEKLLLLRWIEQGAPRGEGEDPLESFTPPPGDWPLGKPDVVVSLPKAQEIPATGVVDYRYVDVPLSFTNDVWVGGAAIKPGNLKCTHHVIVRVKYPKEGKTNTQEPEGLEGWSPGKSFQRFPEGTGKRLRPGAVLSFELHYNTTGQPQTDRTEIGLYLLKEKPPLRYETRMAINADLNLTPGESDLRSHAVAGFKRDTMLYAFIPHMHTRGAWMKYEALYPDGKRETLLSVPRYDFNWQLEYRLAEPRRMPAGTWILCTGGFDNSSRNPHNPDPMKRVHWGEQSFDEMFIGFMNVAELPAAKRTKVVSAE
jgi:peroxiredoxin